MKINEMKGGKQVLLAWLVLALLPGLAWAQAGKVIMARGEVSALGSGGQERMLDGGDPVREGDHVLTGADSHAQLRLSDGALLSLRRNSYYQMQVQDESLLEQAKKLFSGWMRSVSGSIGRQKPDQVKQGTPVATIGIRGTTYQVIHIPEGGLPGYDADPGTHIYLEQGRLKAVAGGDTRFMDPGDVIYVAPDGSGPKPVPQNRSLFVSGSNSLQTDGDPEGTVNQGLVDAGELSGSDIINRRFQDFLEAGFTDETIPFMLPFAVGSSRATRDTQTTHMTSLDWLYQPGGGYRGSVGISGMAFQQDFFSGTGTFFEIQSTGGSPIDSAQTQLLNSTNVYWGVWGKNNFEVVSNNLGGGIEGPWVYMYSLDPLPQDSDDLPGQFSFTYNYVGGTDLYTTGSTDPQLQITGGQLQADFGAQQITVDSLNVENIETTTSTTYQGSASIAEFYGGGLQLDDGDPNNARIGSMGGEFVGNNAGNRPDGIISDVSICDNCAGTPASGTAVFEGQPN